VRVSGGHLCVAEAPTEAAAETSLSYTHSAANFFGDNNPPQIIYTAYNTCCGARNFFARCSLRKISTAATPFRSLPLPPAALVNVPCCGARNFFRSLFASLNFDRCHSFSLASSATGSARKRPLLLSRIIYSFHKTNVVLAVCLS